MSHSVLLVAGPPATELDAALVGAASRWAAAVAPGRVRHTAHDVAGAAREALAAGGPLLIVWPELPVMRPELAAATLDDLASGCEVVLGPLFAGGLYLLAMTRPIEPVLAVDWRAEDALARGFALAAQAELDVGLLRAERGLRHPGDVRAAIADPCLPASLGALLSSPPSVSPG